MSALQAQIKRLRTDLLILQQHHHLKNPIRQPKYSTFEWDRNRPNSDNLSDLSRGQAWRTWRWRRHEGGHSHHADRGDWDARARGESHKGPTVPMPSPNTHMAVSDECRVKSIAERSISPMVTKSKDLRETQMKLYQRCSSRQSNNLIWYFFCRFDVCVK